MRLIFAFLALSLLSPACQKTEKEVTLSPVEDALATRTEEPHRVQVQHILIAFQGSLEGKEIERSQAEAESLVQKLYMQIQENPSDFEKLLVAHSDDQVPGIYGIANTGVKPVEEEFPRSNFVNAFGDVSFKMKPGEFQLVEYHSENSPYGYHILKRLK